MFTFKDNFWKPSRNRSRGNKKTPTTYISSNNERLPLAPFKPSYLNIKFFMEHRDCSKMLEENPWLINVKLYEQPDLKELIHTDFESLTIQLSKDFLEQDVSLQRDTFIRAICDFISQEVFHQIGGEPHRLLVKRYLPRTQKQIVKSTKKA